MKKKSIWTIAIIMGVSFVILLGLQLTYIREMANMKKEQFDESVNRALYQASRNLELNETLRYEVENPTTAACSTLTNIPWRARTAPSTLPLS